MFRHIKEAINELFDWLTEGFVCEMDYKHGVVDHGPINMEGILGYELSENEKDGFDYLNSLDLTPFLREGESIDVMITKINHCYGYEYSILYQDNELFNCISHDTLMKYIAHRYPIKFKEHTTYCVIMPEN